MTDWEAHPHQTDRAARAPVVSVIGTHRAMHEIAGVVLIWFLRDTNAVSVEKRMQSGLFNILSASFHGNTRLDAKLQIEGAFWFLDTTTHIFCQSRDKQDKCS